MLHRLACLACLALLVACGKTKTRWVRSGPPAPPAFWVWHRSSPLTSAETSALKLANTRTLYWQAAECEWDDAWKITRISAPLPPIDGLEIIPVFRLKPHTAFLGNPNAAQLLAREIRPWSPREIQLDFDCPDRLLGGYTAFLQSLGAALTDVRISITALAAWPRHPSFDALARSVSSLAPMFYDLEADAPADVRALRFHPMADPSVADLIRLWKNCPSPWLAGLPNFERLSLYDSNGKLGGHLRAWDRDAVFLLSGMKAHPLGTGITVFEASKPIDLSGTQVPPGSVLLHRLPDAAALAQLASTAEQAGAACILYFALPGPGISAAYSASHLAHSAATPLPSLVINTRGQVALKNPGPHDMPTRIWELELHSDQPAAFTSASPGGFATAGGAEGIPAEFSNTIILRFSRLAAGESLVSGPLITKPDGLTWSIRGLTEKQSAIREDSTR